MVSEVVTPLTVRLEHLQVTLTNTFSSSIPAAITCVLMGRDNNTLILKCDELWVTFRLKQEIKFD